MALADIPLSHFVQEVLIPYEDDEVTRLIIDTHDKQAFAVVSHLTVGGFRDWLLSDAADEQVLRALAPGLTPEMVAAVSKIMRVQDLVLVAQKIRVVTQFRGTLGLRGPRNAPRRSATTSATAWYPASRSANAGTLTGPHSTARTAMN